MLNFRSPLDIDNLEDDSWYFMSLFEMDRNGSSVEFFFQEYVGSTTSHKGEWHMQQGNIAQNAVGNTFQPFLNKKTPVSSGMFNPARVHLKTNIFIWLILLK